MEVGVVQPEMAAALEATADPGADNGEYTMNVALAAVTTEARANREAAKAAVEAASAWWGGAETAVTAATAAMWAAPAASKEENKKRVELGDAKVKAADTTTPAAMEAALEAQEAFEAAMAVLRAVVWLGGISFRVQAAAEAAGPFTRHRVRSGRRPRAGVDEDTLAGMKGETALARGRFAMERVSTPLAAGTRMKLAREHGCQWN